MKSKLVGRRIREYREKAGISQEELADTVGMRVTSISNIERGRNFPTFENFIKIANSIKVPADLLLIDVIDASYTTKVGELSGMMEELTPNERRHVFSVVESLIRSQGEDFHE